MPLICKRNHGPDPACAGHARTQSPARESTLALPQRAVGGDVFCGIGHRRFSRPMAVPWIRSALLDDSQLPLSDEAIEQSIRRDQALRAARPPDAASLRRPDESARAIILGIAGLPPEKGHEARSVVRQLTRKRVGFAAPLRSATEDAIRRLIRQATGWAPSLGVSLGWWRSDQHDAFVKGVAAEVPDVPHRSGDNPFLRDLARPVREADRQAKVQRRKKVRGLRTSAPAVLRRREAPTPEGRTPGTPESTGPATAAAGRSPAVAEAAGGVVRDSGAAGRGILHDDPGGPRDPPGLRMAEALQEGPGSVHRNLEASTGGSRRSHAAGSRGASRRAATKSGGSQR